MDQIGVCCAHTRELHRGEGACRDPFCQCPQWKGLVGVRTRCLARAGVNADPVAGRCWLYAGHPKGVGHALEPDGTTVTRFTDESAYYPSAPTLSAEAVREQLAAHGIGVTAGQKAPRCPYWYEGLGLSQSVRCDLPVHGIADDHQADIGDDLTFRWTSDTAKWRDPQVTVEDVLDKLRRHGKVVPNPKPASHQVGGDHYVKRSIGPWDIWQEYGMNAFEGAVLKYLLRWRDKGGVEDLKKARHTLDKLIEIEEAKGDPEAG